MLPAQNYMLCRSRIREALSMPHNCLLCQVFPSPRAVATARAK